MAISAQPINTSADAKALAALFTKPLATKADLQKASINLYARLESLQYRPDNEVVITKGGRVKIAQIGLDVRTREDHKRLGNKLGYRGRGFFIERLDGSKFVNFDVWSDVVIPEQFTHLFMPFVNSATFREATSDEVTAWFAEVN